MGDVKDGGPAFPHLRKWRTDLGPDVYETVSDGGMSLRDWFAGQALAGLMCATAVNRLIPPPDQAAAKSYEMADALLLHRETKP